MTLGSLAVHEDRRGSAGKQKQRSNDHGGRGGAARTPSREETSGCALARRDECMRAGGSSSSTLAASDAVVTVWSWWRAWSLASSGSLRGASSIATIPTA